MIAYNKYAWIAALVITSLCSCGSSENTVVPPPECPDPPTAPPGIEVALGSSTTFAVQVQPQQTLSISPLPLPEGMAYDEALGVVSFMPQAHQVGQLIMVWTAHEGGKQTSTQTTITVTAEPMQGSTRLSGTVLTSEDRTPLVGVALSIPGTSLSTSTDANGEFLLENIPASANVVDIDGGAMGQYAFVAEDLGLLLGHELYPGQLNVVERPIYLPALGPVSGTTDIEMDVMLMSAAVPQVTLNVTKGNAVDADGNPVEVDMFLPAVTPDTTPAALPQNLNPGLVMAIQPAGIFFVNPARITFPNRDNLPPGTEVDIWSVNPETGVFEVAGTGEVIPDGTLIRTIDGGVRAASWHFVAPPPSGPPDFGGESDDSNGPNDPGDGPGGGEGPGGGGPGSGSGGTPPDESAPPGTGCGSGGGDPQIGSWVDLRSGNLVVDHELAPYVSRGVNQALRFVYNSKLAYPAPVVNVDLDFNEPITLAPPVTSSRLEVGGLNLAVETFTNGSDTTFRHSAQFDATNFPSGSYPYCLRVTNHYPDSTVANDFEGRLRVHSAVNSPFGAGWTLDGMQRLHFTAGQDEVVLAKGDGSSMIMVPRSQSAAGLISDLVIILDGVGNDNATFNRWMDEISDVFNEPGDVWQNATLAVTVIQANDGAAVLEVPRTLITSQAVADQLRSDIRAIGPLQIGSSELAPAIDLASQQVVPQEIGARQAIWLFSTGGVQGQAAAVIAVEQAVSAGMDEVTVFASEGSTTSPRANLEFLQMLRYDGRLIRLGLEGTDLTPFVSKEIRWLVRGAPLGADSYIRRNADGSLVHHMRSGAKAFFSTTGRMTSYEDHNGNATSYAYAGDGTLRIITAPMGKVTRLSYANGFLEYVKDPAGKMTYFEHVNGNLTRITEPDGSSRRFEYEGTGEASPHLMMRQFDKLNNRTSQYSWNPFGSIEAVEQVDGSRREMRDTVTIGLRLNPEQTSLMNPAFPYLLSNHRVSYTNALNKESTYLFDSFGKMTSMRDPLGRETTYTRNQDGYITAIDYPGNGGREAVVNSLGDMTRWRIPGGHIWDYEYDANGRVTRYRPESAGWLDYSVRDTNGNVRIVTDPFNVETHFFYDEPGRGVSGVTGLVTGISAAQNTPESELTQVFYDMATGNVHRIEDPSGRVQEFIYNSSGLLREARQLGEQGTATPLTTSFDRDAMGRVTKITDPNGKETRFFYDLQGNLLELHDAKETPGVTKYRYDEFNRVDRREDPLGAFETFEYDAEGMLTKHVDRKGQNFHYHYDDAGRLQEKEFPGDLNAATNESVLWVYDADFDGNVTNDEDFVSRQTRMYPDGTQTRTTYVHSTDYNYLWDVTTTGSDYQPDFRVRRFRDSARQFRPKNVQCFDAENNVIYNQRYFYDDLRRTEEVRGISSVGDVHLFYDDLGRLERRFSRRVHASADYLNTLIGYFPGGRVDSIQNIWTAAGGAGPDELVSSFSYQYDTYGRRDQMDEQRPAFGQPAHTYEYDYGLVSRLTGVDRDAVEIEGFTYDEVGNRLSEQGGSPWQYSVANRLESDGEFDYQYDENGNRVSKTPVGATEGTSYTWTPENYLESITKPDGSSVFYRYDGSGRRINKRIRDTQGTLVEEHQYLYNLEDIALIEVLRPGGTNSRVFFYHGEGFDSPYLQVVDGVQEAIALDGLGSVVEHVDMVTGEITQAYRYSAFGEETEVLNSSRESQWGTYGFTARERDAESDLMGYRFRMYDPNTGRFISEDPIGFSGGQANLYGYVGNRPQEFVDPSGSEAVEPESQPNSNASQAQSGAESDNECAEDSNGGSGNPPVEGGCVFVPGMEIPPHVALLCGFMDFTDVINGAPPGLEK